MSSDPLLARLRRNAIIACGAIALIAFVIDPGRPAAAIGVIGGGILVAISYAAVAFTITAWFPRAADGKEEGEENGDEHAGNPAKLKRNRAFALLVFAAHYALLALAAYVMIGRLRLHPIGLLGGVTSFVIAVALEAHRPRTRKS